MARRKSVSPAALVRGSERFEKWRGSGYGRRIPSALWAEATRLAGQFGVHRTAVALGLNGTTLKRHMVDPVGSEGRDEGPRFVELSPAAGDAHGCADLVDAQGGRMRVEWRGSPPDLAALTSSFFGRPS